MPQPVDLLVDIRLFLDVRIRARDVSLWLVVIVVRHEILHRVVREKRLKLGRELRRERLVVSDYQRRTLHILDDARHRERLTRSRYP